MSKASGLPKCEMTQQERKVYIDYMCQNPIIEKDLKEKSATPFAGFEEGQS